MSKKPAEKGKGGGSGQPDELEELKAKLLAKELEVFTERDNIRRLQDRSHKIEVHIDHLATASKEKIQKLEDIITFLNGEGKVKDKRIVALEADVVKIKDESKVAIDKLTKEMADATGSFEFKYDSLKLQLESATVKLRELHDFGLKKKALEDELQRGKSLLEELLAFADRNARKLLQQDLQLPVKLQIIKERESKAEALAEAERTSVAAQEKLKKEIASIAADTEKRMTKAMEDQLHSKTKKTIIENEQLRKEVQYHTHQTTVLLKENEKLIAENHDLGRTIGLLKELEDDLAQKNHMYQKTTRILVHKLREKEKQLAGFESKVKTEQEQTDEEDLQELLIRAEQLKGVAAPLHHPASNGRPKKHAQEDAIEFLYACLEDMELETFTRVAGDSASSESGSGSLPPEVPLNELDPKQRHDLLKSLLKRATAVRVMAQSMANVTPTKQSPRHIPYTPDILHPSQGGKIKLDVDGILALPVGKIMAENGDTSASMLEIGDDV